MRSKTNRVPAVTYAVMLAIVASACGGAATVAPATSRPAASSAAVGAPATPTVPPKPATVKLGLVTRNVLWAPYEVAESLGVFKKYNLDVQMSLSQTSSALEAGLINGSLDLAAVTTDTVVLVSAKQPGVVSVAYSELNGNPYSLVVDPSITKLEDLRGKTVVVTAAAISDGFMTQQILSSVGLKAGPDYTFLIAVGGPVGRAAALVAKQGQAMLALEPDITTLKGQGFRELAFANDFPLLRGVSTHVLAINVKWAKENKETVITFLRAWLEAANAVYDSAKKSAVTAAISSGMKIAPDLVTIAHDSWTKRGVWNRTCKVPATELDAVVQQSINAKVVDAPGPKVADMILDPSYCDAALK